MPELRFPNLYIVLFAVFAIAVTSMPCHSDAAQPESAAARDARLKWWRQARFGMFIHWDMSSLAGTEISWSRKGSKPLDIFNDPAGYVEDPVYDHLYERFNPTKFDAKQWVKLAKDAGMKYIVFTAKHHGGFCMWDTKLTNYSIMSTAFHRDVVKELSDACHEAGMPFGLYYSPRDWHHPDYGIGDDSKYLDYMTGQLKELLTNYGKIDCVWFDSFGHGDSISYWHADKVLALVRELQPQAVINNRCNSFANSVPELSGDFDTPEQRIGSYQIDRPWESCMCVVDAPNGGWSYRTDGHVKPLDNCIRTLQGCATGDGNLLLDVGPDPTGIIPQDQVDRLIEVGAWLKKFGRSIYKTQGGPFANGEWGGSTFAGNRLYLHLFQPEKGALLLPALNAKLLHAASLSGGTVKCELKDNRISISLIGYKSALDAVVELTFDRPLSRAAGKAAFDTTP